MDLRSLKHVVVLAKRLSYRKAADELGLTQSALSRSIQAIEKRGNVRLFDRDRGGVHLTAVGREFVARAAGLLREADELESMLKLSAMGEQGEIAFGMAPLPAAALAPTILCDTLVSAPNLRAHVVVRQAESLLQMLLAEEIEFLICSDGLLPSSAPVKRSALGPFPTSLLVRAGHPILSDTDHAETDTYPLITSAPFLEADLWPTRFAFLRDRPQVVLEDHGALLRMTEHSNAVWLSSAFAVADEIAEGRIRQLPMDEWPGAADTKMSMFSLDRRSLSPAAMKFKTLLQSRIRELMDLLVRHGQSVG
jgi:DNA-binding transcriptional LysR family regulator